jgi:predicted DNA-binding transcriptional regulator AlpA
MFSRRAEQMGSAYVDLGGNVTKGPIPPHERFGLSREEAASYVGVSVTLFDEMVKDGRMPRPKRVNSRLVWGRVALERAFAELPEEGQTVESDPWRTDTRGQHGYSNSVSSSRP